MGERDISTSSVLWPLVEALQMVSCLTDTQSRQLVLSAVSDELGRPIFVEEHPQSTMHLFSIARTLSRYPDGLPALLRVLEHIENGATSMVAVRRIIKQMTLLDSWSPDERKELFVLLGGIVVPDIAEIYRFVAGPTAPEVRDQTTYEEMFLALEMLNSGADGVPRPLIFVEHLAARVRLDLALELRRWADRQASSMHLSSQLQEIRRQLPRTSIPTSPQPRTAAYLVFALSLEGTGSHRYRLSHWQQLDTSAGWYPQPGDDVTGSLNVVKRQVATLIEKVEGDWAQYVPDIRVEFVLPMSLLYLDVDQWQWEVDSRIPQPMGCRLSVALRSSDRIRYRKWHRHWHARSQKLESHVCSSGAIPPEAGHWNRTGDRRALRELTSHFDEHPDIVALMLSAPPRSANHFDELVVGLRAGIPIMIWHREDCTSEEYLTAVRDLLHNNGSEHLLDRVRQLRSAAFAEADKDHVGHHLTVLWDDPARPVVPDHAGPPEEVVGR